MRHPWVWQAIAFVAVVVAFASVGLRSFTDQSLATNKPKELELIHSMRLSLLAASEAQFTSLIAGDSKQFEAATAKSVQSLKELSEAFSQLKEYLPKQIEPQTLERVDSSIAKFEELSDKLSALSSQNTNRKAYDLATGEGLKLIGEIDHQLQEWVTRNSTNAGLTVVDRSKLDEVRLSLLRIQSWLIPHISEPRDERMNELEADMLAEEKNVEKVLAELPGGIITADQKSWVASKVDQYWQIKAKVVELSRANSNIRSESLALTEYRDAHLACESALAQLQSQVEAIVPASAIPKGRL